MPELTRKQAAFVREYLVDLNAAAAARRAGYSKKAARMMGCENLTKPNIAAAIQAEIGARSKRTTIDADWTLLRLAEEANADLADIHDEAGNLLPMREWPLIWRQGLVAGIESTTIGDGPAVLTKIKISDRVKRLELIGRHVDVQAFKDRIEHSGNVDIAARILEARKRAGE